MRSRALVIAAAVAGCLQASACRRSAAPPASPPRPTLGEVSVSDLTPPQGAPAQLDVAKLEGDVRRSLVASGLFAARPDEAGAPVVTRVRAQVAIESVEVAEKGLARARVRIRIDTRPSDAPGAFDEQLEGQGEQPFTVARPAHGRGNGARPAAPPAAAEIPDGAALYQGLVSRLARDLVDGFAARRKLRDGPPEAVHAALLADAGE